MFTEERIGEILSQLQVLTHPWETVLDGWRMRKCSGESRPGPEDPADDWTEIPPEGVWGGHCQYMAFAATVTIPADCAGKPVEFTLRTGQEGQWDATNPQFTVYVDGVLRQGFDVNHGCLRLSDCAEAGRSYRIYLSAYTGVQNFHLLFDARLRTVDLPVEQLYYDLLIPWQTACLLDPEETAYRQLMEPLVQAVNLLDLRKPGSEAYYRTAAEAEALLHDRFYTEPGNSEATVCCVGHTHIDVAWLWTLSVTQDKAVRSFSTVLELMDRYPEYIFMSSQPQLYQYVREHAPEVYERIRQRVAEGRWEPEGGAFVEPDCNLTSGESLVRQVLYGKRFFRQEFGRDNKILWLPDVFGYSAALPQILKKAGIRYFMTTKISWNECNQMPYDTFYWRGIDGTKILTHFIPTRDYVSSSRSIVTNQEHTSRFTTNYNGYIHPAQMKGAWQRYQQKNLNHEVLCSYGYGDGGGGPTTEMLETQRRLAYGLPGCPTTKQSTALSFFEQLDRDVAGKAVPVWSGELYLEYHRGTYTSIAWIKKANRRGEFALTDGETMALTAQRFCGKAYPAEEIRKNWEILMRNQFHDILPGSSIKEVYEDAQVEFRRLADFTEELQESSLQAIADGVGADIVWNPNGQTMSGFVTVPSKPEQGSAQKTADDQYLVWVEDVPAKGYRRLECAAPDAGAVQLTAKEAETPFARIRFNEIGQIESWFDKRAQRELLLPGTCGNVLMTYEDKPHKYDNWNIYDYYREKSWPVEQLVSAEVVENGPYRWALQLQWQYQDSRITETLYFYGNSPRVDIRFTTDWQEDQVFLKALFPLDMNTTEATYEIQYGNVKRPTVCNTSWDAARFEVCYHKWMDLSEGGFGVSFLNDCKYGVGVQGTEVGLSLLKCGRYPNPEADRGYHEAVYSVLPHEGSWQEANVVAEAYQLNNPMRVCSSRTEHGTLPAQYSAVSHNCRNVMVEVVKRAEDSENTVIRLYEFENRRTQLDLQLGAPARRIWCSNLLEEPERLLAENTDRVTLTVEPFEIVTLFIEPFADGEGDGNHAAGR